MDHCVSYSSPSSLLLHPSSSLKTRLTSSSPSRLFNFPGSYCCRGINLAAAGRVVPVVAASSSQCGEYSGLNTPLEPRTPAGKFLSSVLLDDSEFFPLLVKKQLEKLATDRAQAVVRMNLSLHSDEACLHRRIAELKEGECKLAVQDVMYLVICRKFYEIRVHLVPRLSKCIYNGRLELCSSRDWELESIYSFELLEMIRDHITAFVGWKAYSSVAHKWARTQIPRLQLTRAYVACVLFGYFLKSVSLRHGLEQNLSLINSNIDLNMGSHHPVSESWSLGSNNVVFDYVMSRGSSSVGEMPCSGKKEEKLKSYLLGFDSETLLMCGKVKSNEAGTLIERYVSALFGDEKTGSLETKEVISTSFGTLKRLLLEAIAFGSFLWEAERYIESVYELKERTD